MTDTIHIRNKHWIRIEVSDVSFTLCGSGAVVYWDYSDSEHVTCKSCLLINLETGDGLTSTDYASIHYHYYE